MIQAAVPPQQMRDLNYKAQTRGRKIKPSGIGACEGEISPNARSRIPREPTGHAPHPNKPRKERVGHPPMEWEGKRRNGEKGHVVSKEGIQPDPKVTEKVLNWPHPTTPTETRTSAIYSKTCRLIALSISPSTFLHGCPPTATLGNSDEDDSGPWERDGLGGADGIPRVARGRGCHPNPPKTSLQDHTPPS
ncbi:hypothetical protein QTP70_005369 [Hemibagrus guttatus]|uniref:Uncharacterized protein n=1 Tax=Hemibagrus guttatus TaxID=175788 RepID=A0AAE0Q9H8_9TELE|nr:hypothetical protein QTP70_005369 [Hemibagrus guttatus]